MCLRFLHLFSYWRYPGGWGEVEAISSKFDACYYLTSTTNKKYLLYSFLSLGAWGSADSALMRFVKDTVEQNRRRRKLYYFRHWYIHLFEMILLDFLEVATWNQNWVLQFWIQKLEKDVLRLIWYFTVCRVLRVTNSNWYMCTKKEKFEMEEIG